MDENQDIGEVYEKKANKLMKGILKKMKVGFVVAIIIYCATMMSMWAFEFNTVPLTLQGFGIMLFLPIITFFSGMYLVMKMKFM